MAIRISTEAGEEVTTIRVEGHLSTGGVPDVRAACDAANQRVRLDLSGMRSADGGAIQWLRSLSEAGAELHGTSPYINQLLLEARKKA